MTLEQIIQDCIDKQYVTMKPNIDYRIQKMNRRGWKQLDEIPFVVSDQVTNSVITDLQKNDQQYKYAVDMFKQLAGAQIQKITLI